MKKLITVSLICIMITLLVSCSAKENEKVNNDSTKTTNENTIITETAKPTTVPTATVTPEPTATVAPVAEIDYSTAKLVALTFDDGPNLTITPLVLDKLDAHGVVATFFLIGQYITEETKPVMERELSLGCEINNHSWSHSYMNKLTPEQIKDEIKKTSDKINEMVGITPAFFRPPFIATSPEMYANIDLPFINGINCLDWDGTVTAEKRAETILANVKDGDIILMHDFAGNNNTVDALDAIIQGLIDDGYTLVTVSQLFEYKGVEPNVENKIWSNTNQ